MGGQKDQPDVHENIECCICPCAVEDVRTGPAGDRTIVCPIKIQRLACKESCDNVSHDDENIHDLCRPENYMRLAALKNREVYEGDDNFR